ncbi:DUF5990 family protein [Ferruginibacter sp.]
MDATPFTISLRIILQSPPAATDYAVQKGSGNQYETLLKQRSVGKDLLFDFTITAKTGKDKTLDFAGPIVQGKAGERFVYIDIGTYAGQENAAWARRLKIPLSGITDAMIKKLATDNSLQLQTKVPGVGKDGGPNCATVKPFAGWQLSK